MASDLFVLSLNDNTTPQLLLRTTGTQEPQHWPEDDVLIYESIEAGRGDLWIAKPASGGDPTPYMTDDADLDNAVVSPSGSWAAYRSDLTVMPSCLATITRSWLASKLSPIEATSTSTS